MVRQKSQRTPILAYRSISGTSKKKRKRKREKKRNDEGNPKNDTRSICTYTSFSLSL